MISDGAEALALELEDLATEIRRGNLINDWKVTRTAEFGPGYSTGNSPYPRYDLTGVQAIRIELRLQVYGNITT